MHNQYKFIFYSVDISVMRMNAVPAVMILNTYLNKQVVLFVCMYNDSLLDFITFISNILFPSQMTLIK